MPSWRITWLLLKPSDRIRLSILIAFMWVGAILEVAGIGLIIPFIGVLTSPELVMVNEYLRPYIELLEIETEHGLMLAVSLGTLVFFSIKACYLSVMYYFIFRFVFQVRVKLSNELLDQYLAAPLEFHLSRNSSELTKSVTDTMQRFSMGYMLPLMILISEFVVVVALLSFMVYLVSVATLVAILIIATPAILFYLLSRGRLRKLGKASEDSLGLVFQWVRQGIGSIYEIKIHGTRGYFVEQHKKQVDIYANALSNVTFLSQLPRILMETSAIFGIVLVVLIIYRDDDFSSTLPYLTMIAFAAMRLLPSTNRMMTSVTNMRFHSPSVQIISNDLDELKNLAIREITDDGISTLSISFERELTLENLSYHYPGCDKASLNSVSLTIPSGNIVGFVGPTGAGKTTLINLILGLLEPSQGAVLVDDQNISCSISNWQNRIGYVPQRGHFVDDTIRRNIALAVPDDEIRDERVWECLKIAEIDTAIRKLPEGLDARAGEDGSNFSGGECQRLCIARALYRNPDVLILDEVSSSLDLHTEQKIARTIEKLRGEKTVVMVTHRLSMIKNADCIYMLKDGQLVDSGTDEELSKGNPEYRSLLTE